MILHSNKKVEPIEFNIFMQCIFVKNCVATLWSLVNSMASKY